VSSFGVSGQAETSAEGKKEESVEEAGPVGGPKFLTLREGGKGTSKVWRVDRDVLGYCQSKECIGIGEGLFAEQKGLIMENQC